jgi:plasmid stabilization system protein ParE
VAIHDYIAEEAPTDARAMVDGLTARSKQIGHFPRSGRMVPEYGEENLREVIEGAYRIIYRILAERVDVLAVIHVAREKPRLD